MDNYNVISPTLDLDKLEKEMYEWSRLPYYFKMRSDEDCIRLYNMTNNQLYNKLKSSILNNTPLEESFKFNFEPTKTIDITFSNYTMEDEDIVYKYIDELNSNSNIAIIYHHPIHNPENRTDIETVENLYKKYSLLPDKFKKLSNDYSYQIYNYNVPNMYLLYKDAYDKANSINDNEYREFPLDESFRNIILNSSDSIFVDRSIVKNKILDRAIYENTLKDNNLYKESIKETLESYTILPYFLPNTLDEEYNNRILSMIEDSKYFSKVRDLKNKYDAGLDKENTEKELLSIGWNPSVKPNKKSKDFIVEKWMNFIDDKYKFINIYDVTNIELDESYIVESSTEMRNLYKEKDLYPIYIVLSFTNTLMGKIIRFVKNSTYSHAGLSLDSNLNKILTFKYEPNKYNGFNIENLELYKDVYDNSIIEVLCVFVDGRTKNKMQKILNYYSKNVDNTKYGFKNLFNILLNKKKQFTDYDLALVCSEFVDHILKLCNVDITKKPNNLVIPQDFATVASSNPRVYKIYEGLTREYNERKVEKILLGLYSKNIKNLKYVNENNIDLLNEILDIKPIIISKNDD